MPTGDLVVTGLALLLMAGIGLMVREAQRQNEQLIAEFKLKEIKKHGRKRSTR
jgi:hypothetical protein